MRKLYVCPKAAVIDAARRQLFHPGAGFHFVSAANNQPIPDDFVILSAMLKDEICEADFLAIEGVAALPDPVFEGTKTMKDHKNDVKSKHGDKHHAALKHIGVADSDTIMEVEQKAAAIHPEVRFQHTR